MKFQLDVTARVFDGRPYGAYPKCAARMRYCSYGRFRIRFAQKSFINTISRCNIAIFQNIKSGLVDCFGRDLPVSVK